MSHRWVRARIQVYAVSITVLGTAVGGALLLRSEQQPASAQPIPTVDVVAAAAESAASSTSSAAWSINR
jgi:hypothetical protein